MKRLALVGLLIFLAVCLLPARRAAASTIWYVNAAAQAPFDGTSFPHGFQTIQAGVNAAAKDDRVFVAQGTYAENVVINGKAIELEGGYAGTDATTHNTDLYPTVIDGNNQGPAVTVTNPFEGSSSEYLYGFTIQNGSGVLLDGKWMGGGVYWDAYGGISDCVFKNNHLAGTPSYGGAVCFVGTTTVVSACTFIGNTARYGGAVAVLNGPFANAIRYSTFDTNGDSNTYMGGAVYVEGVFSFKGWIEQNTFKDNMAMSAGAVALYNTGNETVGGNIFTGNTTSSGGPGGAMYIYHTDTTLVWMNLFSGNVAASYGGGLYAETPGATSLGIHSNVFTDNTANAFSFSGVNGAGLVTNGAYVINNTIAGNHGSGISIAGPSYTANNIVAFNAGGISKDSTILAGPIHGNDVYGNTGYAYGNITDPTGTSGNISADPQFLDQAAGDFHLKTGSPCIDAGNTSDAVGYAGSVDYDDEPRLYGANVDIGADEWIPYLVFTTQPGDSRPNQPLAPQPVITVQDRAGTTLPQFQGEVAVSIAPFTGPTGATLSGTRTLNLVNGVATFTDLALDKASNYYQLAASSPSLLNATSHSFAIRLLRSYVRSDGDDKMDGSTWANAKQTIPSAFTLTAGPDAEVWVATGSYSGPITVPDGITLYGGFGGTETDRTQRNGKSRATIIDGSASNAVVLFIGTSGNGIDAFKITGGGGHTVVDGIRSSHKEGGGIYVESGSPWIRNNLITNNTANFGGGIAVTGGAPRIESNVIGLNSAAATSTLIGAGGGLYLDGRATLSNNFITGNVAIGQTSNQTASVGGALLVASSAHIHNNTFTANQSPVGQGDVYIAGGSPDFVNNIINNQAAIEKSGGTPTFSHNDYIRGAPVVNPLPSITGTNGNISVTPGFTSSNTFRLSADSPLKDIGDDTAVSRGDLDLDQQPRVMGAGVDIGADEIVVPYSIGDAGLALSIAGGLSPASLVDALRLDGADPAGVDAGDVVRIARKAAGLEENP